MKRLKNQALLDQIDTSIETAYPCDHTPARIGMTAAGTQKIVTAKSQLRIENPETSEMEIWSPSLYQSSMRPEYKEIRTLKLEVKDDEWNLQTRYGSRTLDPLRVKVEVTEWIPEIHKSDCRHCTNCGRCGW